jgi:hypothetical protein
MLKTKRNKSVLVAIVIFSMMAMYGFVPTTAKAASMDSAKITLSDSDLGVAATSTVTFKLTSPLVSGDYVRVTFDSEFGDATGVAVSCPAGTASSSDTDYVECTVGGGGLTNATTTITAGPITNPADAGSYSVTIASYHSSAVVESSEMKVYIIDDVTVTAHVAASLTFGIGTSTPSTSVNGITVTGTSSPTAIDFGTILTGNGNKETMAQTLTVSTNAAAGYVVTVQQDHNLMSAAGADIDSANIGTTTTWTQPAGTLAGGESTWGQMSVTSDDSDYFPTTQTYQGLDGTAALPVMANNGASDGTTPGVGLVHVAYTIGITDLQEAGDYSNTLTYICTPTF